MREDESPAWSDVHPWLFISYFPEDIPDRMDERKWAGQGRAGRRERDGGICMWNPFGIQTYLCKMHDVFDGGSRQDIAGGGLLGIYVTGWLAAWFALVGWLEWNPFCWMIWKEWENLKSSRIPRVICRVSFSMHLSLLKI
jgi:hypothetical protein